MKVNVQYNVYRDATASEEAGRVYASLSYENWEKCLLEYC